MTRSGQWVGLAVVSVSVGMALLYARVPAALLLGPMLCGVGVGVSGGSIRVPRWAFLSAQTVIGCLCARSVTGAILVSLAANWAVILAVLAGTLGAAFLVGLGLARYGKLPGSTAAWGSSPGGASAMVVMAAEFGADARLVGFMQYVRVILVTLSASMVSRALIGGAGSADAGQARMHFLAMPALGPFALTLIVGAAGTLIARSIRIPAGAILGPLFLGAIAHGAGFVDITLPDSLLAVTYAIVGWYVGLGFTKATVRHALFALPQLLLANGALILLCAGSAWALTQAHETDALTAYLATSPGGLDSVAIISVGSRADVGFVMAMQTLRVLIVVATGPFLARLIVRWS